MSIQRVVSELNRIKSEGLIVDYAIGGAVAAQRYLEIASTLDVDVFVAFTESDAATLSPLTAVWANLTAHGATEAGQYLHIGDWPVQLLPGTDPLYQSALATAREVDLGGVVGRIMDPLHLAAIALQTGRSKDYPRVAEFLERRHFTPQELREIVRRFRLEERLSVFLTRFPEANV